MYFFWWCLYFFSAEHQKLNMISLSSGMYWGVTFNTVQYVDYFYVGAHRILLVLLLLTPLIYITTIIVLVHNPKHTPWWLFLRGGRKHRSENISQLPSVSGVVLVNSDIETIAWTSLLLDGGLPTKVAGSSGNLVSGLSPGPWITTRLQRHTNIETTGH